MPFTYERAPDRAAAIAALAGRPGAMFLGGGTNLVDLMKLGVARPELLVDVSRLPYDRVEALPDGGQRLGAERAGSRCRGCTEMLETRAPKGPSRLIVLTASRT